MQIATGRFNEVEILLGCTLNAEVAWNKKKFFVVGRGSTIKFGGLLELTFVYAFVAGLQAWVKQLLKASTSIKAMLIEQLLAHTQVIFRDEAELGELIVMATAIFVNFY